MEIKSLLFLFFISLVLSCNNQEKIDISLVDQSESLEIFSENFISTSLYERDIAISNDGTEIIYTLGNYKQNSRCLISLKKRNNTWGDKTLLKISGKYNDIEPFFSPDGTKLFFASDRPLPDETRAGDYNIWVAEFNEGMWQNPRALDSVINTKGDEFYPSISVNGNLYFTATRKDGIGREDIFISRFSNGNYGPPEVLDTMINTALFEFNAYINPDEDLLIFSSFGRADGLGGGDLYFSKKDRTGKWRRAQNLGTTVNTTSLDYCPFIDYNNGNFYFTSDRSDTTRFDIKSVVQFEKEAHKVLNGMGNIFRISLDSLGVN